MNVFSLALSILEASLHTASLEGFAVRNRADFAIGVLSRNPNFQVISLCRTEAHFAGAKRNNTLRKSEFLQDAFSADNHFFKVLVTFFRFDDTNHFDFFELVLTDHSACVFTVRAGF